VIDASRLIGAAHALVCRLIGREEVDRLTQAMLDHEVWPTFLGHELYPAVTEHAEALRATLADHLEALDDGDQEIVAEASRLLLVAGDPARALLELATSAGCFAIPGSLLAPPAADSRVLTPMLQSAPRQ
jgi:hypothetical protein